MMTPQHSPVKAKARGRKGRELERRWTTGLEKGQLNLARNMTATDNAVLATSPQVQAYTYTIIYTWKTSIPFSRKRIYLQVCK